MGDLSVNLKPKGERVAREPCDRARHPQAARGRAVARRTARSRSSRSRPGRRCSRRCSPRSTVRTRRAAGRMAAKVRKAFESVDFVVDVDDSFGVPSERQRFAIDQEALEFHGVAGTGGLRHDRRARRRDQGRLFAARQRPEADRDQRGAAAQRADARRAHAVDAAAGRRHGAPGRQCRTRRRRHAEARNLVVPDLSPQRALRRDGDGRTGGALRGADLRHARGRRQDREHGLGRVRASRKSRSTASRSTSRSRRCCGTASGR